MMEKLNEEQQELTEARKIRPEVGAIWKRQAKTKDMEYMTIRLRFDKNKLQQLLNSEENDNGLVEYDLVSFPNSGNEENAKRPAFRIYEDLS